MTAQPPQQPWGWEARTGLHACHAKACGTPALLPPATQLLELEAAVCPCFYGAAVPPLLFAFYVSEQLDLEAQAQSAPLNSPAAGLPSSDCGGIGHELGEVNSTGQVATSSWGSSEAPLTCGQGGDAQSSGRLFGNAIPSSTSSSASAGSGTGWDSSREQGWRMGTLINPSSASIWPGSLAEDGSMPAGSLTGGRVTKGRLMERAQRADAGLDLGMEGDEDEDEDGRPIEGGARLPGGQALDLPEMLVSPHTASSWQRTDERWRGARAWSDLCGCYICTGSSFRSCITGGSAHELARSAQGPASMTRVTMFQTSYPHVFWCLVCARVLLLQVRVRALVSVLGAEVAYVGLSRTPRIMLSVGGQKAQANLAALQVCLLAAAPTTSVVHGAGAQLPTGAAWGCAVCLRVGLGKAWAKHLLSWFLRTELESHTPKEPACCASSLAHTCP